MENINDKKVEEPVLTVFEKDLMKSRIEHIKTTQRRNLIEDFVKVESSLNDNKNDDKRYLKLRKQSEPLISSRPKK